MLAFLKKRLDSLPEFFTRAILSDPNVV